jgi:hypothetical protein
MQLMNLKQKSTESLLGSPSKTRRLNSSKYYILACKAQPYIFRVRTFQPGVEVKAVMNKTALQIAKLL